MGYLTSSLICISRLIRLKWWQSLKKCSSSAVFVSSFQQDPRSLRFSKRMEKHVISKVTMSSFLERMKSSSKELLDMSFLSVRCCTGPTMPSCVVVRRDWM